MSSTDATESRPVLTVTGATGKLGGRVAARLAAAGRAQTLLVRAPERAPRLPGARTAVATYGDQAAGRAAVAGTRTLFMVSAAETPERVKEHHAFIDAAAEAGVERIVYLSFFGAAPDATFTLARDHWATEEHLRATGLAHVILRDNLYLDFLPGLAAADGTIYGPAADGRVAAVAQDDIADAAAAILLSPDEHDGRTYELTGPVALTLDEIAGILAKHEQRPVRYVAETVEQAYASRAGYGAPPWQLDAWVSTYTAIAAGDLARVTADIPALTGHAATSLPQLLARG